MHPNDIPIFVRLHMNDKNGYLQRFCLKKMTEDESKSYVANCLLLGEIIAFTVITKEGKASRIAGFMYLSEITERSCAVNGIMDPAFAKGLGKLLRQDKYTYSEDSLRTMVNWIFTQYPSMHRIVAEALEANRPALKLFQRAGFTQEGILRDYFYMDGQYFNTTIHSLLRKEWTPNEYLVKENINRASIVSETNAVLV